MILLGLFSLIINHSRNTRFLSNQNQNRTCSRRTWLNLKCNVTHCTKDIASSKPFKQWHYWTPYCCWYGDIPFHASLLINQKGWCCCQFFAPIKIWNKTMKIVSLFFHFFLFLKRKLNTMTTTRLHQKINAISKVDNEGMKKLTNKISCHFEIFLL